MPLSFFRSNSGVTKEQNKVVEDYELACSLTDNDRESRQFRARIALRGRAHLDKCFIEGAEQTERFEALITLADATGAPRPAPPEVSEFQEIQTINGRGFTYLPKEVSARAFKLGVQYQSLALTAKQSITAMQSLVNQVCVELRVDSPPLALGFLREETGFGADDHVVIETPENQTENRTET